MIAASLLPHLSLILLQVISQPFFPYFSQIKRLPLTSVEKLKIPTSSKDDVDAERERAWHHVTGRAAVFDSSEQS